jgi:hypothetical protein
MRVMHIPTKHQATWRDRPGLQAARYNLREDRAYRPSQAGLSRAPGPAVIGTFTSRASPLRRGAGFAEKRCPMQSNGKLVFNIRISTEDEINGTVKGDV